MNLPNVKSAVVEREKLVEYLLNVSHPDNGGKAVFFLGVGFSPDRWQTFAEALRRHALTTPISRSLRSEHGCKYVLEGPIDAPFGGTPQIRSVWIIDKGEDAPRLVTAYPYE